MQIAGFNTVLPFDYTGVGGINIPLGDGSFTLSSNTIDLNSIDLAQTTAQVTLDPVASGSIPSFTYSIIDEVGLPITVSVDATGPSSIVTVTYAPTIAQRAYFRVRLAFSGYTVDLIIRIASISSQSAFTVSNTLYDFGDFINSNPSIPNNTATLVLSSTVPFNPNLVSLAITTNNSYDSPLNFSISYLGVSQDGLSVSYALQYTPEFTPSDILIQFLYNQSPVGDIIRAVGTWSGYVTPAPIVISAVPQNGTYIVYKNSSSYSYRITSLTLLNDSLGEFSIVNSNVATGSVLLPNEVIYVPLTYVQKQPTKVLPKLVLHGIYY